MAVRRRGISKEYADEIVQEGIATQKEMEDMFTTHVVAEHDSPKVAYAYDTVRQKYLDTNVLRVVYYLDKTEADDEYMYYIKDTRSCVLGFTLFDSEKYCLVGVEYVATSEADGVVMEVRNITDEQPGAWGSVNYTYDTIYSVDLGTDKVKSKYINDIDIVLLPENKIVTYVTQDADIDNPVLVLLLRKIWEEDNGS